MPQQRFFLLALLTVATLSFAWSPAVHGQEVPAPEVQQVSPETQPEPEYSPPVYMRAKVVAVLAEEDTGSGDARVLTQTVRVRILTGDERGQEREVTNESTGVFATQSRVRKGEQIVLVRALSFNTDTYYVADHYRMPQLVLIFAIFFGLAVFFGRLRGVTAILGLVLSIFILARFILPRILEGGNPLLVSVLGAGVLACVALVVAHGWNRRTGVALLATLITLGIAVLLAVAFVAVAKLFGLGNEDAAYLPVGELATLNLRGLLLGGIIIGTLGVLDDVTTTQSAAVEEIARANPALPTRELYQRGLSVGREHIASLVNTLALAYAGASLPLLLLFTHNAAQPFWVVLNSEMIAEEIVRTLVGSASLILAVPITTLLAALLARRVLQRKPA